MHKAFGGAVVKKADGGKIAKGMMGAIEKASKAADAAMAVPAVNRLDMNFKDVTKRVPELTDAANMLAKGDMTAAQYDALVTRLKPVTPYSFVPAPATAEDAMKALTENKKPMFGKTGEMSAGEQADLRLDIPAYKDHGVWVNSIHRKDQPTVYGSTSSVKNATMIGAPDKALKVAQGGPKAPFAVIRGDWNPMSEEDAVAKAQAYLDHPDWKQVGYDPERHGYFYDRSTMKPVQGAEEVIQIGPLVLAKKPIYGKKSEEKYVDGGKVAKGIVGALTKASKMADDAMAASRVLPIAERDANLAKYLDKSKVKNRAYHATDQDVKSFDPKSDKRTENKSNIAGWMTNDPEFANDFAAQKFRHWKTSHRPWEEDPNVPPGANIMPVHLSIENPFYATDLIKNLSGELNMDEANAVAKALGVGVDDLIGDIPKVIKYKQSNYEREHTPRGFDLVKSDVATDAMKRLGYDGVIATENGSEVYAPFNSTQIKSATGNRGTYDITKPDINEAKGGAIRKESPEEMKRFSDRFAFHKANGKRSASPQKFDGGGIASPSDEVNQGAAFGIYQKPKGGEDLRKGGEYSGLMAELLAKMAKDQGKEEVSSLDKPRAATDILNRGVLANNPVSAVIDMINMGLVPLDVLGSKLTGRDIRVSSDKPFLGSEYVKDLMNQYGVTSGEERPMMETALSFASPTAMIKGAMKATDAAKKVPELIKKATDAFTSSKLPPLATEAKTASAGKPTGATYATKQDGPFFRVSPTALDTSKAKSRGIREGDELQGSTPLGGSAESTGRETPQFLSSEEVGRIIADPVANEPLNIAKKYTQETQGVDFGVPNIPESTLAKQSAIGRTQQLAIDASPEYKTAVFDAYAKQMPDVLEQAGAKNYDDLMEKAYRQMAKETDDQFRVLPYNFSYHRAGEGNYNGAMDMASDVHGNKHLYVYQGGDKHDFLNRVDPASGLNENEKFRAVHDLLGHAIYGNQFGPKGEEMAWAVHSQMYSPLARLAMTSETRGQNSMVNYSPLNAELKAQLAKYDDMAAEARRKGDKALLNKISAAKRQAYSGFEFAPNKAVLLPPEFLSTQYAGGMPAYLEAANRPVKGTETQSVLTHFSNDPNLRATDPGRYGTGIKGAEGDRLRDYPGAVRDRSYFYMGEPGTVAPEPGLGVNRYRGEASSLYDITQDPLNFQKLARESNRTPFTAKYNQGITHPLQDANDIERLVKEYGYQGMANPKASKPMAIMFKETPVRRQARGGLTLMK